MSSPDNHCLSVPQNEVNYNITGERKYNEITVLEWKNSWCLVLNVDNTMWLIWDGALFVYLSLFFPEWFSTWGVTVNTIRGKTNKTGRGLFSKRYLYFSAKQFPPFIFLICCTLKAATEESSAGLLCRKTPMVPRGKVWLCYWTIQ